MLISPPFLPARTAGEDDTAWVERAMTQPAGRAPSSGAQEGSFPVSSELQWHNGLHIQAPRVNGADLAVRAIASGAVVFARAPTAPTADAADPLNYMPDQSVARTDNGVLIVEHEGEIGATATTPATPTTFKFYALYMHLGELGKVAVPESKDTKGKVIAPGGQRELAPGDKVQRKDTLGIAGQVYGARGHLHFEICLKPGELQKLIERAPTWVEDLPVAAPRADGRTDSVFGSVWIYLPANTPTSTRAPTSHLRLRDAGGLPGPVTASGTTLNTNLWVQISCSQGNTTVRSYTPEGKPIGGDTPATVTDPGFEYKLYAEATKRHASLAPDLQAASSPSGWYELLRFGRNLGPDPLPADAAHWRQIPTAGGNVWVDLNARGTFKFSDADFPAVAGWNCYDDDTRPNDQRCDSSHLKRRIRAQMQSDDDRSKPGGDRAALAKGLGTQAVRQSLRRTICKFPSEWDRGTIAARYEWLRDPQLGFGLDHQDNWERFAKHLEAVTFPDLPQGYKDAVWHVHPTQFIVHMRQCGWLDRDELQKIYPESVYASVGKTSDQYKDLYRLPLNLVFRKYGLNTPYRMAHFFGQSAVESYYMMVVREVSTAIQNAIRTDHITIQKEVGGYLQETSANVKQVAYFKYLENNHGLGNTDPGDGIKFRGRGFKQLTGRYNYAEYWIFRGWINRQSYSANWFAKSPYANGPHINTPEDAANEPLNAVDTAGFFCTRNSIHRAADTGINLTASHAVTAIVNLRTDAGSYQKRLDETISSWQILGE